jgi:pimeloyl-ACP methyl ester carboxylesterase
LSAADPIVRVRGVSKTYAGGFQVPLVPETLLLARDAFLLRSALERSGLDHERAVDYCRRQQEPGALTAALSWYRAVPFGRDGGAGDVTVPTTYVWSTGDAALGRRAAELTGDHVAGPYYFEVLEGVSHWIPEQEPEVTADIILDRIHSASEE